MDLSIQGLADASQTSGNGDTYFLDENR